MNYLAHIFLSGNNDLLKIGNFMADGIRGNDYMNFPEDVKNGIILHRHIDTFTDAHPIYRKSKHRLHEKYGHYAGVIMDILYDHFLAKNWSNYSDEKLDDYVANFYKSLEDNYAILTEKTRNLLPYMTERNWLTSYGTIAGIEMILFQMDYRTKHRANMQEAVVELQEFYSEFEEEFTLFFEELRAFCLQQMKKI
ncbi:Acyl carrier protein phosphodiesterase [Flavobacterium swingsii]|uniref:Acyl carrier protein phosphodiesterase n=1 Tax=Flavobacterium swingsii TaxID=498292 RepID=A0A1I0ZQG6_9FLAO|nr:acyl carrier protein phosphodiesterase [Flavobacterium swingsii]SFB27964.1 Acyl carrier protein phosphodiesterase [Flavobacterium swingsii]